MLRVEKSIETGSSMVRAGLGQGGTGSGLVGTNRVSLWEDGKALGMDDANG